MRLMAFGLALMTGAAFGANPPPSDRILSDLSRCDRTFFATLGQHAGEYASNPHFRTNGTDRYFAVADRSDQKLSIRKFSPPLKIGWFDAVAYFDEVFVMSGNSQVVGGIPQEVLKVKLVDHPEKGLTGLEPVQLIDRVLVGPCEHSEVLGQALRQALESAGVADAGNKIIHTGIPLRAKQR